MWLSAGVHFKEHQPIINKRVLVKTEVEGKRRKVKGYETCFWGAYSFNGDEISPLPSTLYLKFFMSSQNLNTFPPASTSCFFTSNVTRSPVR